MGWTSLPELLLGFSVRQLPTKPVSTAAWEPSQLAASQLPL